MKLPAPTRHPMLWVPSLYLAMGIPFNMIMSGTAVRMFKSLGYTDGRITVALGSIGVAWSLKPLWAAFLDMYGTKKMFVLVMELILAGLFCAVGASLPLPTFFSISIAIFWVAAFVSSTQDICADGIYLTALEKRTQAEFAGVQGTFWVLGKLLATGVLISILDRVKTAQHWPEDRLWAMVMVVCAGSMVAAAGWHYFVLPTGTIPRRPESTRRLVTDFAQTASSFFHKRMFWGMIAFVFLYRLGEGLIMMEGQLFLQSDLKVGGLGLTAGQVSNIDAIWGTLFSIISGLLGGLFISRMGLKRALPVLGLCLNLPHFTYVYLSHLAAAGHGVSYLTIATLVSIEKFGYGFGFVGNMVYMMQQLAPGRWTMTHYAFATSLMNLVLVPTNMISGPLAEWLGFSTFFAVVMFASIPSIWAAWNAPFPLKNEDVQIPAGGSEEPASLTVDDPSLLTTAQRSIQAMAGRASLYAMLNILVILIVDARILGYLREAQPGAARMAFGLLLGTSALKLFLAQRAYKLAHKAKEGAAGEESIYFQNARGAKIATLISGVVSFAVLGVAAKLTFPARMPF